MTSLARSALGRAAARSLMCSLAATLVACGGAAAQDDAIPAAVAAAPSPSPTSSSTSGGVATTPAAAPASGRDGSPTPGATPDGAGWTNPVLKPGLPQLPGNADQNTVPEGLTLVDDEGKPTTALDPARGIVVFIHGRGGGDASPFPAPKAWRAAGWNTLVFRWYRRANDPTTVPRVATATIPGVSGDLIADMDRLHTALGGDAYTGELRVVGHSLGAIVGALAGPKMFPAFRGAGARRLELLDPGWFKDALTLPAGAAIDTVEVGSVLTSLVGQGIHTVVYSTVVSRLYEPETWRLVNVQYLARTWLGFDVVGRHNAMIPYYFGSLTQTPTTTAGGKAFSAAMPTAEIAAGPRYLEHVSGVLTSDMGDDTYQE